MEKERKIPWQLQDELIRSAKLPSEQDMVDKIRVIPDISQRALVSTTFLTCARVGEVVKNKYNPKYKGIRKSDIRKEILDGETFTLFNLLNQKAKRKSKERKDIPIKMSNDIDRTLVGFIRQYTNTKQDNDVLFPMSTSRAAVIINKHLKMNPHFLRHLRLTHLCHQRDYSEHHLMQVAGWSDTRQSSTYIETKWQNVARQELKND